MSLTREEMKQLTRQKLLDAAIKLFSSKGIMATSTADIAKTTSLAHGSVFLHFATRDDLVNAVIDEFGQRLSAELEGAFDNNLKLGQVLKIHLRVLQEFEDFYARLVIESPLLPVKVRSSLFMLQSAISHEIYIASEKERKQGKIRQFERHLLFNTWLGLIHYYLANKKMFTSKQSIIEEKGDELLKHFMSLIKK